MQEAARKPAHSTLRVLALLAGLALIGSGGAFAWSQNGDRMFLALIEAGVAWCF